MSNPLNAGAKPAPASKPISTSHAKPSSSAPMAPSRATGPTKSSAQAVAPSTSTRRTPLSSSSRLSTSAVDSRTRSSAGSLNGPTSHKESAARVQSSSSETKRVSTSSLGRQALSSGASKRTSVPATGAVSSASSSRISSRTSIVPGSSKTLGTTAARAKPNVEIKSATSHSDRTHGTKRASVSAQVRPKTAQQDVIRGSTKEAPSARAENNDETSTLQVETEMERVRETDQQTVKDVEAKDTESQDEHVKSINQLRSEVERLQLLGSSHENDLETLHKQRSETKEEYERTILGLKDELKSRDALHEERINTLIASHARDLEAINRQHDSKDQENAANTHSAQQELQTQIKDLRASNHSLHEDLSKTRQAHERDDLHQSQLLQKDVKERDEKIKRLMDELEITEKNAKMEHSLEIAQLKEKHDKAITASNEARSMAIEEAIKPHVENMELQRKEHDQALQVLRNDLAQEQSKGQSLRSQIESLTEASKSTSQNAESSCRELERENTSLKAQNESREADMKQKAQSLQESVRRAEELTMELGKIREDHQASMKDIRAEHQSQLASAQSDYALELEKLRGQHDEKVKALDKQMRDGHDELNSRLGVHQARVTELESSNEKNIRDLQTRQTDLDQLRTELQSEALALRSENEQLSSNLRIANESLETQSRQSESKLKALEIEKERLAAEVLEMRNELQLRLQAHVVELDALKSELAAQTSDHEKVLGQHDLDASAKASQEKLLRDQNSKLQTEVETAIASRREAEASLERVIVENKAHCNNEQRLHLAVQEQETLLEALKTKNRQAEEAVIDLRMKMDSQSRSQHSARSNGHDSKISKEELDKVKEQHVNAIKSLAKAQQSIKSLTHDCDGLKEQLHANKSLLQEISEQHAKQLDDLQQKHQTEIENLISKMNQQHGNEMNGTERQEHVTSPTKATQAEMDEGLKMTEEQLERSQHALASLDSSNLHKDLRAYMETLRGDRANDAAELKGIREELDEASTRREQTFQKQSEMRAVIAAELEKLLEQTSSMSSAQIDN